MNGVKHFLISLGAIAGAAILGYLANDAALLDLLTKSGIPGWLALSLVPIMHALIAMARKHFYPPEGLNDPPPAPDK